MTMSATDFKAKCLQILERVRTTGEHIYITKHGKVIAELGPVGATDPAGPGIAKGILKVVGDIVEPYDAGWETK
ncbi:MAG: type II toxin-antitoxin system prevent-host-death family antitoxin [Fimbriimonadales bacterium]